MAALTSSAHEAKIHLPGESGVWVFIIGNLFVFGLFFVVFMYDRSLDVPLYTQSQATLNQTYGAVNTFLMLSSSWLVVLAIQAARDNLAKVTSHLILLAGACGVAFVVVKSFEYSEKISAGYFITSNDFYMYYYMLTGIHLMHVVIGLAVLTFLWHTARTDSLDENGIGTLESGASYWHLVDIVWIILFALLYLMR